MIFPTLVSAYDVLELKYCERCGGLGVRPSGGGDYCRRCAADMRESISSRHAAGATATGGAQ